MNKISTKKKCIKSVNTKMTENTADINEFPCEPGSSVINNILNYSKALSIRKSASMEYFEVVLN